MSLKNRKGIIKIGKHLLDNGLVHDPKLLSNIFKDFFPTGVEYSHLHDLFTYYGYSSQFKEIKEGEEIPNYDTIVAVDKSTSCLYTIEFKEIID